MKHMVPFAYLLLAAVFGGLFYVRYWAFRDCIAEAVSGCVTPDGDTVIEGGAIWGIPALLCLSIALWRFLHAWLSRRGGSK